MGAERKLLTCRNCGRTWAVPTSRGSYPNYCPKQECQAIRRDKTRAKMNASRRVREDRRSQLMRKRNLAGLSQIANHSRHHKPEPEQDDDLILQPDETIQLVSQYSNGLNGVSREELGQAVFDLSSATGSVDTYGCLLQVAAVATAWARRIRPGQEDARELIAA